MSTNGILSMKGVPSLLNEINTMLVLRKVWLHGTLSRADLWRLTGLSKPTVSKIVEALLKQHLLEVVGEQNSSPQGGKPALLYRFNPNAATILVCVVHETFVEGAVGDCSAKFRHRFQLPIDRSLEPQQVFEQVIAHFKEVLKEDGLLASAPLMGVGVSLPGVADIEQGLAIYVPGLPKWRRYNIRQPFREAFGVEVWVENESRLMALAEHWFGRAQGVDDFVSLSIGDGVGGAVFLNGRLWRGTSHLAGEVGHMRIGLAMQVDSPPIPAQVVNNYLATWAFVEQAKRLAAQNPTSLLAAELDRAGGLEVEQVMACARSGDAPAQKVISQLGYWLGLTIGNMLLHYDVPLVVLHGPYRLAGQELLDIIASTLSKWFLPPLAENTSLCYSEIERDIELVGAVSIVLQQMFALSL